MSALGHKRTCASQNVMSALHPKADMCGAPAHVCFGPKADSCSAANRMLFDHFVGACEQRFYSITSSAATIRPGETERPSAFAVLRLRVVSYFVGVCTGRSAGFAPRRMRSM